MERNGHTLVIGTGFLELLIIFISILCFHTSTSYEVLLEYYKTELSINKQWCLLQ